MATYGPPPSITSLHVCVSSSSSECTSAYTSRVLKMEYGHLVFVDCFVLISNLASRLLIDRIEKHLQCEKLLGLAGGNTKKHGNKKSGECITPIRYNVLHMYIK